jgi:predicted thioesterase
MINIIEAAALNALEHLLPVGHQSLGTHLDVTYVAATPVGLRVTATATVLRWRAPPRRETNGAYQTNRGFGG